MIFHFFSILVQELYGQSSGRIRSSSNNINSLKTNNDFLKQYKLSRTRERSPSFIQSRRYHLDQLARDYRDLGQPLSYQSQIASSSYYTYGGSLAGSNQEGCRLTDTYCSRDYHCCSGKCRCIRWSVMGKMSCLKKCF